MLPEPINKSQPLYAPEVNSYLQRPPGWLARYGTLLSLLMLLGLLVTGLSYSYPVTVEGGFEVHLPRSYYPLSLTKPLQLQRLLVSDGQRVETGQALLVGRDIRLRYDHVFFLEDELYAASSLPIGQLATIRMPTGLELGPLATPLAGFEEQQSAFLNAYPDSSLLRQSFVELQQSVADWKAAYTLFSPSAGTVQFRKAMVPGQLLEPASELLRVSPLESEQPTGRIVLFHQPPQKVTTGQSVVLDLDNQPALIDGSLRGEVTAVRFNGDESRLDVDFRLRSSGLTSSTGTQTEGTRVLTGRATIITGRHSLIDRLFGG